MLHHLYIQTNTQELVVAESKLSVSLPGEVDRPGRVGGTRDSGLRRPGWRGPRTFLLFSLNFSFLTYKKGLHL